MDATAAFDFVARGDAFVNGGDLVRAIAAYTEAIRLLPTAVEGVNEKSFQVHLYSSFATDASRRAEYFLRFAPALWK